MLQYISVKLLYLFIFMTVVWALYAIMPKKNRCAILLIGSFAFIFIISKWLALWLVFSSFVIYLVGLKIDSIQNNIRHQKDLLDRDQWLAYKNKKRKMINVWMAIGVILNLLVLIGFKYTNSFISFINSVSSLFNSNTSIAALSIVMPLGISYYTLQTIGYLIDVKRGKYKPEHNFFKLCLFVSYFPQLLEGPIGRYDQLKDQLLDGNTEASIDNYSRGLLQILFGLFKKIVVADRLGILVSEVFTNYASYSGWVVALGITAFTIELYCEFSGIIDIVTGVTKCFGIDLAKNFAQPLLSISVGEFWRRWHISLGSWFRDYVFYPLTMNKLSLKINKANSKVMTPFWSSYFPMAITLIIVWSLTGMWHGVGKKYLFYGFYYGVIMCIEMIWDHYTLNHSLRKNVVYKGIAWIFTIAMVNVGMLIFKADSLHEAYYIFLHLFSVGSWNFLTAFNKVESIISIVGILIVGFVDVCYYLKKDIREFLVTKSWPLRYLTYAILILAIVIFGAYGHGYAYKDPIYGGF